MTDLRNIAHTTLQFIDKIRSDFDNECCLLAHVAGFHTGKMNVCFSFAQREPDGEGKAMYKKMYRDYLTMADFATAAKDIDSLIATLQALTHGGGHLRHQAKKGDTKTQATPPMTFDDFTVVEGFKSSRRS